MGKPAAQIIDYANRNPFNLIVMATHGRSGIRRCVLGSVADRVVSQGNTPVLVVRASGTSTV